MVCRTAIDQTLRSEGADEKVVSLNETQKLASKGEETGDSAYPDAPYPVAMKYPRRWR